MKPELNWTRLPCCCALAGCFFLSCTEPAESLEERAADYGAALIERDRVRAQEFVAAACRNSFLRQKERIYRSWEIQNIQEESEEEAVVRVAYEGYFEDLRRFMPQQESQLWRKTDGEWFLHVDPPEERIRTVLKGVYSAGEEKRWGTEQNGQVTVNSQIRIPFFNKAQLGTLTIRNGSGEPVRVAEVALEEGLFKITENPAEIPSGQKRHLKIVYLGTDELKNQKSPMTVVIEQQGKLGEYPVEILYNYLSPGLRGMLGLKADEIDSLKRTDRVNPAISVEVPAKQAAEVQEARDNLDRTRQP